MTMPSPVPDDLSEQVVIPTTTTAPAAPPAEVVPARAMGAVPTYSYPVPSSRLCWAP
ncbi:hypothetical protein ACQGFI_02800 [Rhodococcus sp. 2.95]